MTPLGRWSIVVAGIAALLAAPFALRALPVDDAGTDAAALLTQVQEAEDHPYSGYVESQGTLQLPVTDGFTDVGALLGEETRMRVWWRGEDRWRVDKLLTTGEVDLVHDDRGTTRWRAGSSRTSSRSSPQRRRPSASPA